MPASRSKVLPPIDLGAAVLVAVLAPQVGAPQVGAPQARAPVVTAPPPAMPLPRSVPVRPIALPPPPVAVSEPTSDPVAPSPVAAGAPARTPAPHPPPVPEPVVLPVAADVGRGRLMLDRIAGGQGPSIEIAWPADAADRRKLRGHLERCAGWRVLLLARDRLWRAEDPAGHPWTPAAAEAPSGLVRDLEGVAATDGDPAETIRARHGLAGGRPVAVVARRWDARLLGGLQRLLGGRWGHGAVRARYAVGDGRLSVVALRLDDGPVAGRVDLGPLASCAR